MASRLLALKEGVNSFNEVQESKATDRQGTELPVAIELKGVCVCMRTSACVCRGAGGGGHPGPARQPARANLRAYHGSSDPFQLRTPQGGLYKEPSTVACKPNWDPKPLTYQGSSDPVQLRNLPCRSRPLSSTAAGAQGGLV